MDIADKLYNELGEDVCLYDDRMYTLGGEKFADADLMGCPIQLIISKKTIEQDSVEVISRTNEFERKFVKISEVRRDTNFYS